MSPSFPPDRRGQQTAVQTLHESDPQNPLYILDMYSMAQYTTSLSYQSTHPDCESHISSTT